MTGSVTDWTKWADGRRPLSLPAACAWLLAAVLLAYAVVGTIAADQYGASGWMAAAIAAATCWFAQTTSLIATGLTKGPLRGFYSLVYGLAFGFLIPFGAGWMLSHRVPHLAQSGIFGLMVAFYLITLTAGTLLTVRLMAPNAASCFRETSGGSRETRSG